MTMHRLAISLSFLVALAVGIAAAVTGGQVLYAAEKVENKEAYVPPGAEKKTLVNESLPGLEGQRFTVDQYTFPPGWVGGKHYHTGPVYVYVLEGSFTVDEQGKERGTFKAGDVYKEPIGTPMQARNLNASEPLKVLVVQITREGEAPMYKVD
jgi:quercetin dioxygenase-like cupin family protein